MKNTIFAITLAIFICIVACHKSSNNPHSDCGCITDSIKSEFTDMEGILRFDSVRNSWGITIQFASNNTYECKICNTDSPSVSALIKTLSEKDSVSVIFTGKLKKACQDEIDFNYFPENQPFDISIDSLNI